MINHDDTICAIATALSPAGVGIIRVSGDKAIDIVSSIFVNKAKQKVDIKETHKIHYGYIFNRANDNFIDEVLIMTMLKPKSYTAEDVVEIQCHGGLLVLKNILKLLVENGARIAREVKIDGIIGDNVIIAANSVVTSDIPPNSMAAGVPARIKKSLEWYLQRYFF